MKKINENNTNNRPEQIRLPLHEAIMLGVCLAFAGLAANATPTYRGGDYSFSYGNQWAGANGLISASAGNDRRDCFSKDFSGRSGYSRAYFSAYGDATFLKCGVHAVDFVACAVNNYGSKSATYSLQLAGYNVDSGSKTQTFTWSKSVSKTFWSGAATYVVCDIPITLTGSIGGGGSIGYSLLLPDSGAGLAGGAASWLTGTASAGIGLPFFSVGLYTEMELGKTSIQPSLNATPTTLSGKVDLVFNPINIELDLAVMSYGKPWASVELVSYHAPSLTYPLVQGFSLTNNICGVAIYPGRVSLPSP